MLLVICGKMCSGKDTVVKRLVNHGFKKVVTYTTRPPRKGEKDGINYHFISKGEFKKKIQDGFFLEWRSCKVASGEEWYYGSAREDIVNVKDNQKRVVILSPSGVDKMYEIKRSCPVDFRIVWLKASWATILSRSKMRGDDREETVRRIESDGQDFCVMDLFANKVVWNNLDCELGDVVQEIVDYVNGEMKI